LRRENSEASEPELLSEETIQENEELVKKAEEAEELRQLRSQRYTDSVYSKIVWK
jgi:tripartite-type tricarboxylate transporter receptor subunit TctC